MTTAGSSKFLDAEDQFTEVTPTLTTVCNINSTVALTVILILTIALLRVLHILRCHFCNCALSHFRIFITVLLRKQSIPAQLKYVQITSKFSRYGEV